MRPVSENIKGPMLRISAQLSVPEGCTSPECGEILERLMKAAEDEFPAVLSIERGDAVRVCDTVIYGFGMSLAAEVKHE